jgi:hypothetical protein
LQGTPKERELEYQSEDYVLLKSKETMLIWKIKCLDMFNYTAPSPSEREMEGEDGWW